MTTNDYTEIYNLLEDSLNDPVTLNDINNFETNYNNNNNISNKINIEHFIKSLQNLIKKKSTDNQLYSKSDFISYVKQKNLFKSHRDSIINTNCENIIKILQDIHDEAIVQNDMKSLLDIKWIIKTLNEENIYEIDPLIVLNDKNNLNFNNENKNGIAYLMIYSKIEDIKNKTIDFNKVRNNTRAKTYSKKETLKLIKKESFRRQDSFKEKNIEKFSPEINAKILTIISKIDQIDFDLFTLDEISEKKGSFIVGLEIINRNDLCKTEVIDSNVLKNFIQKVVDSYSRENAIYHNDLHAADVMQTLFTMIVRGELVKKMKLEDLDKFAILVAAICHDLKHTGQNNMFHINSKSKIAIRYNDISVLENYHIANTFKILKNEKFNILKNFKPEEFRILRRRIIDGILATDMANHQKVIGEIKKKTDLYLISKGINFTNLFTVESNKLFDVQQCMLNMCLHTADISNPAKPLEISEKWTYRVYEEFFRQGELEKKLGLSVSLLCDRDTTNVNKAMIGFVNFIVMPTIDLLVNLLPEVEQYSVNIRNVLKKHEIGYKQDMEKEKKEKEEKEKESKN
jgi:hypothetical protein